jgi:tetratricopeptide (TPR) repeat protein
VVSAAAAQSGGQFRLDAEGNWVREERRERSPDEATMARARELLAEEKAGQAESLLTRWIDEHKFGDHPLLAQAYLLRGDAKTLGDNEYDALYDYETVLKEFVGSEEFPKAVERELQIGIRYLHGLKRRHWGFRWVPAEQEGEELLVRVQERMPGSRVAERAAIELADYYYRIRDLKMAADAYEIFVTNFPRSEHVQWARQRRIYANIARFKGPNYDATGLRDARVLIEDYADVDPAGAQKAGLSDALVARLEESEAAQMLQKAQWYTRRGDSVSARYVLRRLVKAHPQTVAAGTAAKLLEERGWSEATAAPAPAAAEAATSGGAAASEAVAPEAGR